MLEANADLLKKTGKAPSVLVGFTAGYALYVHEDLEATWKGLPRRSGKGVYWGPSLHGPKFLEAPARSMAKELGAIVGEVFKKGATLLVALFTAGLKLQAEAQKRVPVELGNLRASAFTREDKK